MKGARNQEGFTLVELLVTFFVFSLVSVGFYQVMFMGSRGTDTTESVVRISEEARLGFNRLIRDTREASDLIEGDADSYRVTIDFDSNGIIGGQGVDGTQNVNGDFEDLTFSFFSGQIRLNGELLIDGVECLLAADGTCSRDVFAYESNKLEYDWDADGVTTALEIDDAGPTRGLTIGNQNGVLDTPLEFEQVTSVSFAFSIRSGDRVSEFFSEAQLRNRR